MTATATQRSARLDQDRQPDRRQAPQASAGRDRSIDLVRAGCLIVVVALHAMMVGVTLTSTGPVFENALENASWFPAVSWFVQMMPLFFIAGGFSGLTAWRRSQAKGATASDFVRGRLQRLLLPAIVVMATVGIALVALTAVGVSPEIVAVAGFRISQPLWFLGVYVLCQAFLPLLARAHERHPVRMLVLLGGAAALIDATRIATGIEAIGFLNLAFVWLFVQQLGFWLADGRIGALSLSTRWALALSTFSGLLVLVTVGPYSPDMYVNLNPPTLALMGLAIVQLALLSLAQPMLRRLAERRVIGTIADAIGSRSMTIYLWHMPTLIALAGLSVLLVPATGFDLPAIGSGDWWATRPAWLLIAVVSVGVIAAATARFERLRSTRVTASTGRVVVASVIGVLSVGVLFVLGLTAPVAALSVLLMAVSLRLATRRASARRSALPSAHVVPQGDAVRTVV